MKQTKTEKVTINMRLPKDLVKNLKDMTEKEHRTFSGQVEYLLDYAIDKMKVTVE